ncbi:MAG: hypothetical protein J1F11_00835 [Oscillospiraceae bacterium]|nr:hypothetical protein [Oscillospiraceae bacterium]
MNILNKLERKFGRYYISNLMLYIVIGTGIVFASIYLFPDIGALLLYYLSFDRTAILHGQIWRIISFVFLPESFNPISMLFWLYLYWMIGSSLENYWGGFRFNLYYFSGVLFAIIAGFITGYATNYYLNLSLFLAIAILNPNMQLLLFFFIPVKMKWLGWLYVAILVYSFIFSGWGTRVLIIISLLNIVLFFGGDFFGKIRDKFKYRKVRKNFRKNIKMTTYKDEE